MSDSERSPGGAGPAETPHASAVHTESPSTASREDPHGVGHDDVRPEDVGHPRGTLAIVVLYGLLFALGWVALYVFKFLEQGAPTS